MPPPLRSLPLALFPTGRSGGSGDLRALLRGQNSATNLGALLAAFSAVRGLASGFFDFPGSDSANHNCGAYYVARTLLTLWSTGHLSRLILIVFAVPIQ
ncbi:hypothetical protein XI06_15555 [Bradyrhizobium sp. CCBAU 11434]|nr:hypothetical protein [Bradyrhizobium sp. CCBAU 11434]